MPHGVGYGETPSLVVGDGRVRAMTNWDITGTWHGEYHYDPGAGLDGMPHHVDFTLDAQLGWLGRFRGLIQDDAESGAFAPATMVGRVCGSRVSFRKQYPHFYVTANGKLTILGDLLEARDGILLDADPPPQPIWYHGTYDERNEVVTGTWRIKLARIGVSARGQRIAIMTGGVTGRWSMWRGS
jgi:hypothetical protein